MFKAIVFAASMALSGAAYAGPLNDALGQGSGECVPMSAVRPLVKHDEPLNAAQFDFLRGMWMTIPPVSTELPIGDKAELITDGEDFGVVLIDSESDQTCARFRVPNVGEFLTVINQVGEGKTIKAKDAAGKGL